MPPRAVDALTVVAIRSSRTDPVHRHAQQEAFRAFPPLHHHQSSTQHATIGKMRRAGTLVLIVAVLASSLHCQAWAEHHDVAQQEDDIAGRLLAHAVSDHVQKQLLVVDGSVQSRPVGRKLQNEGAHHHVFVVASLTGWWNSCCHQRPPCAALLHCCRRSVVGRIFDRSITTRPHATLAYSPAARFELPLSAGWFAPGGVPGAPVGSAPEQMTPWGCAATDCW